MPQNPVEIFPSLNSRETQISLLNQLLEKESLYYSDRRNRGIKALQKGEGLVTAGERDVAVQWLCSLARGARTGGSRSALGPDTLSLSVAFLDEILTSTRVQSKYLYCLSLTSLYLAAKLCEEPELVPYLADLNREFCASQYSIQELSRMERVLLTRLNWTLTYPTIESFIQLMLAISLPQEVAAHLLQAQDAPTDLRCCLESVLTSHKLLATCNDKIPTVIPDLKHAVSRFRFLRVERTENPGFQPSLLALAMISLTLEARGHPQWFGVMVNLQKLFKVNSAEVIKCREAITTLLSKETNKENRGWVQGHRDDSVFGAVQTGENKGKSPRKRIRQRSKGSDSSSSILGSVAKIKTPLENIFVDEIADVVWI